MIRTDQTSMMALELRNGSRTRRACSGARTDSRSRSRDTSPSRCASFDRRSGSGESAKSVVNFPQTQLTTMPPRSCCTRRWASTSAPGRRRRPSHRGGHPAVTGDGGRPRRPRPRPAPHGGNHDRAAKGVRGFKGLLLPRARADERGRPVRAPEEVSVGVANDVEKRSTARTPAHASGGHGKSPRSRSR